MNVSVQLNEQLHAELNKQIEELKKAKSSGELCIIDLSLISHEDDRSRTTNPNFTDTAITQVSSELVLLNSGEFVVEERVIRVSRAGDIEEYTGDWKDITN